MTHTTPYRLDFNHCYGILAATNKRQGCTVMNTSLEQAQQFLNHFANQQVPMIGFCTPTLIDISAAHCEVMLPLNERTQNHLACLYFGALSVGADITGGFLAMMAIQQSQQPIELLFKDFTADFKRRANGDTHFICHDGEHIKSMIENTLETGNRVNHPLSITAHVPTLSDQPVAQFTLTLSLKYRPTTDS